jgi:plasmid stabilization system protein ParE
VPKNRPRFHPGAEDDYAEAFAWYFARSPSVAFDFEREVERGLRLIVQNPLRWPKFDGKRRRMILRKFPYSLICEIIAGEVIILAVAHGRRRPYYWLERSRS